MGLRYVLTLMGFFALFSGFIYNDFMSTGLNLFGSCYDPEKTDENHKIYLREDADCVYSFGILIYFIF